MDAHTDGHAGDDPVAHDIETRNPDSGDVVAGEQVLDEGHVAPDQDFADAVEDQQYTEANDPTVTRFDAGAGGVAESRDDTSFSIDPDIAQTPPDQPTADPRGPEAGPEGQLDESDGDGAGGGPHRGAPEGVQEPAEQRRTAADERSDAGAPPAVEEAG